MPRPFVYQPGNEAVQYGNVSKERSLGTISAFQRFQCTWRPLVAVAYSYEVASKEIASLGNGVKMAIPTEVEDRLLVLERLFEVRLKFVGCKST